MKQNQRTVLAGPVLQPAIFSVILWGSLCWSCGLAQTASPETPGRHGAAHQQATESALAAIRAESTAFVAAFNARDAKAVAALWTDDAEYIDDSGNRFAGRDAIEKGYAAFFAEKPQAEIRIMIDSLRLLSDQAAIEDGRAVLDPAPAGAPGISKYTAVHVKLDGKWLMASVRDTWLETSSAYQNIAALEWLIGTWVAEEHGTKTESVCRWVGNKSFLERHYTTTHADGTKATGVQLIGWNPEQGHVQSWSFSPDGGHAVGIWSPQQDGWTAEMRGVTGEGTSTTAVNVLARLDEDAYVWRSVQRTAGGMVLPDSDEVIWKRRPANR
jgi:uncharacterized protein (TIGR02246 family)